MRFEWDEEKRKSNLRKHGIDFADIEKIFFDESYTAVDDRFDYGEIRYQSLFMLFGEVISVTHTETEQVARIISARKADKYEQEKYFREIRD